MKSALLLPGIILSAGCLLSVRANPMEKQETVYMKKSTIEDQDSSATGYSYQIYSGPQPQLFGYPPITVGRYSQEPPTALRHLQLPLEQGHHQLNVPTLNSYGLPVDPAALLPPPPGPINGIRNEGEEDASSSSFGSKGGGSNYGSSSDSSNGFEDSSGYKKSAEFAKGAKGLHENEQHKGYYGQEGENKAARDESGRHFDKKEEAAQSTKGGSFRRKSGHKKGSKTTGFHRVHHKDEYKKDHEFYDESDASGHFRKYGDFDAKEAAEKGRSEKGGRQDAGYSVGRQGQRGFQDKGRFVDRDSGYRGAEGKETHFKDGDRYVKKAGQQQHNEKGFSTSQINNQRDGDII